MSKDEVQAPSRDVQYVIQELWHGLRWTDVKLKSYGFTGTDDVFRKANLMREMLDVKIRVVRRVTVKTEEVVSE